MSQASDAAPLHPVVQAVLDAIVIGDKTATIPVAKFAQLAEKVSRSFAHERTIFQHLVVVKNRLSKAGLAPADQQVRDLILLCHPLGEKQDRSRKGRQEKRARSAIAVPASTTGPMSALSNPNRKR
jgi:hypothetical protein